MKFLKWAFFIWFGAAALSGIVAAISAPDQPMSPDSTLSAPVSEIAPPEAPALTLEQELRARRERGLDSMKAKFQQPARKGQIESMALMPYTRDQFPKTVAKYGRAIPALERDRAKAAKIAATHPDCDVVENVQVTTRSPMVNRRYWVECSNVTRLFFDEASLAEGKPSKVQTVAAMGRDGLADW